MTDLELTKACAEAMGYQTAMRETPFTERGVKILFAAPYDDPQWQVYNPLHNDDQAMALVRKFRLQIDPHDDHWNVAAVGKAASLREDLNRAIVECVAKLKERP